ncbi:MAG: OmpA family protein [Desulfobacterium sp.]|nr:OmpA family protein [Desulfobacterium sp.]
MNVRMLKTMVFMVGLLTALLLSPFNGFANMSAISGLDSAVDQHNLTLRRDNVSDTIKEYWIEINSLDERLLALKLDLEWFDLKLLDIQGKERLVPQELIDSRKRLIEQQALIAGEKENLLELIQNHALSVENLTNLIQQGKDKGESSIQLRNSGGGGDLLASNKGSNIVEGDLDDDSVNVLDGGFRNPKVAELERRLRVKIKNLEISDWVELLDDNSGLRLEVQLPILFASGSSTTTSSYDSFFKKIAVLVKPHDAFIHVKGGADGFRSKKISNIDLGAKRAASIVNRLVEYGLPPSIFKITSRGEYQQDLPSGKTNPSLKRRAEITVYFNG